MTDGAGTRCRTRCWRSGRPAPTACVPTATGSLRRDGWTFTGWGRASTDDDGRYSFTTVRPVRRNRARPPFFAVTVFARGLLNRLFTRAYLPGEQLAADPLLSSLPADRRDTLIAAPRRARSALRHPPAGRAARRCSCASRGIDR